jgi:hypothetical protein
LRFPLISGFLCSFLRWPQATPLYRIFFSFGGVAAFYTKTYLKINIVSFNIPKETFSPSS